MHFYLQQMATRGEMIRPGFQAMLDTYKMPCEVCIHLCVRSLVVQNDFPSIGLVFNLICAPLRDFALLEIFKVNYPVLAFYLPTETHSIIRFPFQATRSLSVLIVNYISEHG